jgi:glycosyltransferase involved in cell wall biosynthesis
LTGCTIAIDARLVSGTSTGDSTYWTELIAGFAKTPTDDRFLLFSNADAPKTIPDDARFRWIRVPARSSRWWSLVGFPLAARKMGADVVHVQYSLSPLIGRRGITTVHDISFLIGPQWFTKKDRLILTASVPSACRRAARVITVSETSKTEIEQRIPAAAGKTRTVYNACPSWIRPQETSAARKLVEDRFGIRGPYLLTVGTRWPRKNMKLAIDAVERLTDSIPHRLVLTGKSGWGEQQANDKTVAVGYVDAEALSALYGAADLYLAPSLHEGFGIPVLEAFRCRCPVLSSTGGALPEISGNAAEIEPTWSPDHWAKSIESLLADPSKLDSLRNRGVERERGFSWEHAARKTIDVYHETIR